MDLSVLSSQNVQVRLRRGRGLVTAYDREKRATRYWWDGKRALPVPYEFPRGELDAEVMVERTGTELVTTRLGDGAVVGRVPFESKLPATFYTQGYAARLPGFSGDVVDRRTGAPIPDGDALVARLGFGGRLDLLHATVNPTKGYYRLRRTSSDGSVQETRVGNNEFGFESYTGTEDGPMALRFEGSNVGYVANYLISPDLRVLPVMPEIVHDVSPRGFLVSIMDGVVPLMTPDHEKVALSLVEAQSGKTRWTRPMPDGHGIRWCGDFPIVHQEKGVAVLSPTTGRALLVKPWPLPDMRLLGDDLYGRFEAEKKRVLVFQFVVRRDR